MSNCHAMRSEEVKLLEFYVGTKYGCIMFRLFYSASKQSIQARSTVQHLSTVLVYLRLGASSTYPELKLKNYPLLAICDSIFNIFHP
jgi:hypothetical protein